MKFIYRSQQIYRRYKLISTNFQQQSKEMTIKLEQHWSCGILFEWTSCTSVYFPPPSLHPSRDLYNPTKKIDLLDSINIVFVLNKINMGTDKYNTIQSSMNTIQYRPQYIQYNTGLNEYNTGTNITTLDRSGLVDGSRREQTSHISELLSYCQSEQSPLNINKTSDKISINLHDSLLTDKSVCVSLKCHPACKSHFIHSINHP